MLRRLLAGLIKGALIGGGIGVLLSVALGITSMPGLIAYAAAMLTGVLVALVAGKPIWARGAWVEVLLKSVAAAALSAGLLWAARNVFDATVTLGPLGSGQLGELPLVVLPALALLLSTFFELDNDEDEPDAAENDASKRARVAELVASEDLEPMKDDEVEGERRAHHNR